MTQTRRAFLAALLVATAAVVLVTGWTLGKRCYPGWREREIERAVVHESGPSFWWPSEWREEYAARQQYRVERLLLEEANRLLLREHQRAKARAAAAADGGAN